MTWPVFLIFTIGPHLDPNTTSENILKMSSIEAVIFNCGSLIWMLSCYISRSRIPHIIYRLKSRSLVVFFRMVYNEKIFRSPNVKCPTFSERPT